MQVKMDFTPAEKELRACKRCLDRMISAESYEEYEESWSDFLNRLEKIFEKLDKACFPIRSKFISLISKENMLRGSDPLLQYLKQARNADTHTIQEIAQRVPGSYAVGFDTTHDGKGTYIESLKIVNGSVTEYKGSHPLVVTFTPESVEVKEVVNRQQRYAPPATHLGKPLDTLHPTDLAKLGIEFYQQLFDKVKAAFQ
ncbi:hypothetical protein V4841_08365 [Lelliottia amnigena]|uniref:Uncharacterized protein n=1 Tax=Lelliottia amnigena TaxID=61646 RepID=A0ABU7UC39_LELAM